MEDEQRNEYADAAEAPSFAGIAQRMLDVAVKADAKTRDGARRLTRMEGAYQRHLRRLSTLNNHLFVLAMLFCSLSVALYALAKRGVVRPSFAALGTLAQGMSFGLLLAMFILLISLKPLDSEPD